MSQSAPAHRAAPASETDLSGVLREIVGKHARNKVHLHDGHVLTRDLGFDSLAFLLTVADVEERLGCAFPLEKVDALHVLSFGDLVRLVAAECGRLGGATAVPANA